MATLAIAIGEHAGDCTAQVKALCIRTKANAGAKRFGAAEADLAAASAVAEQAGDERAALEKSVAAIQREVARAKATEIKDRKKLAKEISKWCDVALSQVSAEQLVGTGLE